MNQINREHLRAGAALADDFVAGITLVVGELLGGQVALNVAVERGAFLEREVEDVLESWV